MDDLGIRRIKGPTILLASGEYFDFEDPEGSKLHWCDIAHALSHLCRFTGHCRDFYSVAEHSVHVSYLVPERDALAALMHDAAEAVLGDVSKPLKALLPDYKALERRVEAAIFRKFGLPEILPASVKAADLQMLFIEQRQAMHNDDDWQLPDSGRVRQLEFLPPGHAFARFTERYLRLTGYPA